jgi:hypothetical protein
VHGVVEVTSPSSHHPLHSKHLCCWHLTCPSHNLETWKCLMGGASGCDSPSSHHSPATCIQSTCVIAPTPSALVTILRPVPLEAPVIGGASGCDSALLTVPCDSALLRLRQSVFSPFPCIQRTGVFGTSPCPGHNLETCPE